MSTAESHLRVRRQERRLPAALHRLQRRRLRAGAEHRDDVEVTVNYNPIPGQPSSFNVTDDRIEAPGKPTVTVAGGTVTIFTQSPTSGASARPFKVAAGRLGRSASARSAPSSTSPTTPTTTASSRTTRATEVLRVPRSSTYDRRAWPAPPTAFSEPTGNISVPRATRTPSDPGSSTCASPTPGRSAPPTATTSTSSPSASACPRTSPPTGDVHRLSDPDGTTANVIICGTRPRHVRPVRCPGRLAPEPAGALPAS